MTAFGIVTLCTAFTFNYGGIITCRLMLGVFEAGLFPGVIYMLSYWYSRWELQTRICELDNALRSQCMHLPPPRDYTAVFYAGASGAGAFAGAFECDTLNQMSVL